MRNRFKHFYKPSPEEFEEMWKDTATFVFDANVLVKAYEVKQETREALFRAMEYLAKVDRVWLPYQAGKEFFGKRYSKLEENRSKLDSVTAFAESTRTNCEQLLPDDYPHLDHDKITTVMDAALEEVEELVSETRENLQRPFHRLDDDHVLDELEEIFKDRTGERIPDDDAKKRVKEWRQRCQDNTPPGAGDKGPGDYLIWCEILVLAESSKEPKPVILITDDNGWFERLGANNNVWGPSPVLRREFFERNEGQFWAYKSKDFLYWAREHLGIEVEDDDVEDLEDAEWDFSMFEPVSPLSSEHLEVFKQVHDKAFGRAGTEIVLSRKRSICPNCGGRTIHSLEIEVLSGKSVNDYISCPACGWTRVTRRDDDAPN